MIEQHWRSAKGLQIGYWGESAVKWPAEEQVSKNKIHRDRTEVSEHSGEELQTPWTQDKETPWRE